MDSLPPTAVTRWSVARIISTVVFSVVFAWPLPESGRLAGVAAFLFIASMISGITALIERQPIFASVPTHLDEAAIFLLLALGLNQASDHTALQALLKSP